MKLLPVPHPVLLLVSAPSGTGKTTLCKRLLAAEPQLRYSVSSTTRPPREGERDGVDYHFLDRETFLRHAGEGAFLEYAEVHGNYYGTGWQRVRELFSAGYSVLMDVDVQGARLIRAALRRHDIPPPLAECFHDVFLSPPGLEVLRQRLEDRAQDSAEVIERRLRNAEEEMAAAGEYDFQVINDELDSAFAQLQAVYRACTLHTVRRED